MTGLYFPTLHGVVELLPRAASSTIKLTPEMYSRILAYECKNRGMWVRAMTESMLNVAVKHQLKWVSDTVRTQD